MGDQRTAPEGTPPPELDDTPDDDVVEEPVDEPVGEPAPDTSASGRIAQAEYTRATQAVAFVRKELGLPKTATQAEISEALAALRSRPEAVEDDEEADVISEREREAIERARAADLRVASAIYGEDFTSATVEFINLARTSDDLDELLTAAAAYRDRWGPEIEAAAAGEEADEDEDEPGDLGIGTSEGDRAPQSTQPSGGRRESGVVGAIRGLFAAAADDARRPRS